MKIRFAPAVAAEDLGFWKKRRQPAEEPLTEKQAERLQSLLSSMNQKPQQTNRSARHLIRDRSLEQQLVEAAKCLGINLSSLNPDQQQLLISMSRQTLTDAKRREMLSDAE